MSKVNTGGLDKLQRALGNLSGPLLTKFKGRATYFVAIALKGVLQKYPGQANSPVIWPSEKARRYYFAMRREEGLGPRYVRRSDQMSQRLHAQWAVQREDTEATLGNRAAYSAYVQSSEYQTEQHKATGWTTDEQAADKLMKDGTIRRIVNAHINTIVKEAFRGF